MDIYNFKYGMGYCARGAAMTALCVMTIVNVYGFSASSKQTDDRLMTEKEKYEVLDSVCAVLGESIYDSNVYGMKLDNGYLLSQREELADSLAGLLKHRGKKTHTFEDVFVRRRHLPYAKIACKHDNSVYTSTYELHKLNPLSGYDSGDFCDFTDGISLDVSVTTHIERPPYEGGVIAVESLRITDAASRDVIKDVRESVRDIKAELISNPEYEVRFSLTFDYDGSSYEVTGVVLSPKIFRKYMTSYEASMEFRKKYGLKVRKVE